MNKPPEETPAPYDQPAPVPNAGEPVWPLALEAYVERQGSRQTRGRFLNAKILADMRDRDKIGRERYGTPLCKDDGRDHGLDCYQELLDAFVYAVSKYGPNDVLVGEIANSIRIMGARVHAELLKDRERAFADAYELEIELAGRDEDSSYAYTLGMIERILKIKNNPTRVLMALEVLKTNGDVNVIARCWESGELSLVVRDEKGNPINEDTGERVNPDDVLFFYDLSGLTRQRRSVPK